MWLERLHAWIDQGIPCVLATITEATGPVPRRAGAKMAISLEGQTEGSVGGGVIEHRCLEVARNLLEPRSLHFILEVADWREAAPENPQAACAGRVTVFLEPVLPPKEVVAFGGGHISECLSRLCVALGLPFRVYDARPAFANRERFPQAREALCAPYDDLSQHIRLSSASHCVVLTHGHAQDEQVLEQLLQLSDLPYIGMVGSSRKLQGIRERLAVKGLTLGPHVYTPAGLALGGGLPGDIALSILAEIKLVMDGGRPEHLRRTT
jgi:xanthine dehydrogenase accessory factor